MKPRDALVAIGSNLSFNGVSPPDLVRNAIGRLRGPPDRAAVHSPVYRTPAFPEGSGPDYANATVRFAWRGTAEALMEMLHGMEKEAGRRRGARWAARTLDLDLIAFGESVLPDEATWLAWRDLPPGELATRTPDRLIVPHPRLQDRAFVLVPLADTAPDWRHPVTGLTARRMLDRLPPGQVGTVRPY